MNAERGEGMAMKIVGGAIGLIIIIVAIVAAPDLKRYMRMRSM